MCKNCKFWLRKGKLDDMDWGDCTNEESEYYDSSISEEDGCSEFEEL